MIAIRHLSHGQQPPADRDWVIVEGLEAGGYTVRWKLAGIEAFADWPNGPPPTLPGAIVGGTAKARMHGLDTLFVREAAVA